jgi:hypothetical protein
MSILETLDLEDLSPSRLWTHLDDATREEAVRSAYNDGTQGSKVEADMAIANALRFRPNAVRQLPLERRVAYMLKNVYADDNLASTMLLALHLDRRVALLGTFLDELGIPQSGGLIDDDYDLETPGAEALERAAAAAYEKFDEAEVDLYLAALLALDPGTWGALREVIAGRAAG